jgi:hypothetical protein
MPATIKRIKTRSALKHYAKALKQVKMSIKFQAMHVKELAKISAQKVSILQAQITY